MFARKSAALLLSFAFAAASASAAAVSLGALTVESRPGEPLNAVLEIERPKGEAWCLDCCRTVPMARYGDPCPICGGYRLTATGGTEMRVIEFIERTPDGENSNEERDS